MYRPLPYTVERGPSYVQNAQILHYLQGGNLHVLFLVIITKKLTTTVHNKVSFHISTYYVYLYIYTMYIQWGINKKKRHSHPNKLCFHS